MGATFVEKILARKAGVDTVRPGQILDVAPDLMLSHDNTAAIARIFAELPVSRVRHPERMAVTLDHAVPAPTAVHARNHAETRRFVAEQGVGYFSEAGRGICHQVLCEDGLVGPGMVILGADSHSTHYGALGAFGAGVGRSEMAALWATGQLWLMVPESMRIELEGRLRPGVTAKDLVLKLIGDLGADGALYRSVEFGGPGLAALSMSSRMVLTNMMAEMGAKCACVPPDELTFAWVGERSERRFDPIVPDSDAVYEQHHHYDLSALEPMIAAPHRVDHVFPLSEVAGRPVQQAFVGTCTNGRLEDIAAAAEVLRGRKVAAGARMLVIPASSQVYQEAIAAGYVEALLAAGAMIGTPGCGPCMGNHMGVPAAGEVCISSGSRNYRGRMGEPEAEVYLASPAVVAASAVAGVIAGPEAL